MKAFTLSAAILASAVAALPTGILPTASGILPSSIPTSLPSGLSTGGATSEATNAVHSVLTVTNQAKESVPVKLHPDVANRLAGFSLGSAGEPVGYVVQTAGSASQLNVNNAASGLITVATSEGEAALIQLYSAFDGLVSLLGLSSVTDVVGTLERAAGVKRSPVNDVVAITNGDQDLLVHVAPQVLGLLGTSDLSNVQGAVGKVVGSAPTAAGLTSAAQGVPVEVTQLFGVQALDGSALLVQVESVPAGATSLVSSLLSTLGLSGLEQTVGTVVGTTTGVAPI